VKWMNEWMNEWHQNYKPNVLCTILEFKWPPLICMMFRISLRGFQLLSCTLLLTIRNLRCQIINAVLYVVTLALIPFIHPFHWHVQNVTIPCCSQELLPILSVIDHFLPHFFHQLVFKTPSLHRAVYFFVYLSALLLHKFI
jgi:hypothetical protein